VNNSTVSDHRRFPHRCAIFNANARADSRIPADRYMGTDSSRWIHVSTRFNHRGGMNSRVNVWRRIKKGKRLRKVRPRLRRFEDGLVIGREILGRRDQTPRLGFPRTDEVLRRSDKRQMAGFRIVENRSAGNPAATVATYRKAEQFREFARGQ
jgi:hypothetical protein